MSKVWESFGEAEMREELRAQCEGNDAKYGRISRLKRNQDILVAMLVAREVGESAIKEKLKIMDGFPEEI